MARNPDKNFWQSKRVLVTGHTGFKGGWLCAWLEQLGAEVFGVALAPTHEPNLWTGIAPKLAVQSSFADIRDQHKIRQIVERIKPEVVLHLAAQPLVRESYRDPLETFSTNVMGTANVLDAVRVAGQACAVVLVTTDKVYANREWLWGYRENERLGGHDPYSNSKACAELVAQSYRDSFFPAGRWSAHLVGIATARAGNVIGGGDWSDDRLMPDLLRAHESGLRPRLRNPSAIRPWQHVLEPLCGYLLLSQEVALGNPITLDGWNFGPRESDVRSVGDLTTYAVERHGLKPPEFDRGDHPHEAGLLGLDSTKAAYHLNWRPRWSVERAVDEVFEWHKAFQSGAPALELCRASIEAYTNAE